MKSVALAAIGLIICGGTVYIDLVKGLTMKQFEIWQAGWQKHLCEDDAGTLLEEMLTCVPHLSEEMYEILIECQLAGLPDTTNPMEFVKTGCADTKVFEAYNNCAERHIEKEDFVEKVEENGMAFDCFVDVMTKRGFNLDV